MRLCVKCFKESNVCDLGFNHIPPRPQHTHHHHRSDQGDCRTILHGLGFTSIAVSQAKGGTVVPVVSTQPLVSNRDGNRGDDVRMWDNTKGESKMVPKVTNGGGGSTRDTQLVGAPTQQSAEEKKGGRKNDPRELLPSVTRTLGAFADAYQASTKGDSVALMTIVASPHKDYGNAVIVVEKESARRTVNPPTSQGKYALAVDRNMGMVNMTMVNAFDKDDGMLTTELKKQASVLRALMLLPSDAGDVLVRDTVASAAKPFDSANAKGGKKAAKKK